MMLFQDSIIPDKVLMIILIMIDQEAQKIVTTLVIIEVLYHEIIMEPHQRSIVIIEPRQRSTTIIIIIR